jgi:hypothetical protein
MKKSGGLILAFAAFAVMTTGTLAAGEPVQPSIDKKELLRVLSPEGYKRMVLRTEYDQHTVGIDKFLELKQDPKAVILDLRDEKQFQAGHIRGAKYLGADVEDKKLVELVPDKTTPILLYCTNSLMLTRMISLTNVALPQILAHGYKNVYLLKDAARDLKDGEAYDARLKQLDFVEQPTPAPQPTTGEHKQ